MQKEERITIMTAPRITNISELSGDYTHTRILSDLFLGEIEGDVETHKNYFDSNYHENPIIQHNAYIGRQLCPFVRVDKVSDAIVEGLGRATRAKWRLEIIIADILPENSCNEILNEYCYYASCNLLYKSYNLAYGVPRFTYHSPQIWYGTNEVHFDREFWAMRGYAFGTSTALINYDFALPKQSVNINDVKYLFDSLDRRDSNSKFLALFMFLEAMIDQNRSQVSIEKGRESRSQKIYNELKKCGIGAVKQNEKEHDISVAFLKDIIETRDSIAHRKNTKDIISALYDKLLPTIMALLLNNVQR